MAVKHNPAGRLRDLMDQVRSQPKQQTPIGSIWGAIFDCDPRDTRSIIKGLGNVIDLTEEARAATKDKIANCPEFYLAPYDKIDQLCGHMHMETPWRQVAGAPDAAIMTALEFVEHLLAPYFGTASEDNEEKIIGLLSTLDQLIEECVRSDLGEDLKTLFVKQLQSLRSALLNFRIGGAQAIQEAVDQATGSLVRYREVVKHELDAGNTVVSKFFDTLGKINEIAAGYQLAMPALTAVSTLLLSFTS